MVVLWDPYPGLQSSQGSFLVRQSSAGVADAAAIPHLVSYAVALHT